MFVLYSISPKPFKLSFGTEWNKSKLLWCLHEIDVKCWIQTFKWFVRVVLYHRSSSLNQKWVIWSLPWCHYTSNSRQHLWSWKYHLSYQWTPRDQYKILLWNNDINLSLTCNGPDPKGTVEIVLKIDLMRYHRGNTYLKIFISVQCM